MTTTRELAEKAGYSRITFDVYLNRQPPTRRSALRLADELERRSKKLAEHAERLREAAADDEGGASRDVGAPKG